MTLNQWEKFKSLTLKFKNFCEKNAIAFNNDKILLECQTNIAKEAGIPEYEVKNLLVYNNRFEEITQNHTIKLILIGDNPGKNEQLQSRYLVGQAGKLAQSFFTKNSELGIDFNNETLILNKSPLHTAKTLMLKKLIKVYETKVSNNHLSSFFALSQSFMAKFTYELHSLFDCAVFLIGYGEVHDKGIFSTYKNEIVNLYQANKALKENFFCFQHFSMNRFSVDLKQNYNPNLSLKENLQKLGKEHSKQIFNF